MKFLRAAFFAVAIAGAFAIFNPGQARAGMLKPFTSPVADIETAQSGAVPIINVSERGFRRHRGHRFKRGHRRGFRSNREFRRHFRHRSHRGYRQRGFRRSFRSGRRGYCGNTDNACDEYQNYRPRYAYGGHRYRHHRRYRGDAFIGAIIGGAALGAIIDNNRSYRHRPRRAHRSSRRHVNWCHGRYRSYRSSDNTFQPYRGRRKACRSPYG